MRKSILGLSAVAFAMLATPAMAQEEAADPLGLTVTGTAGLVSDYRFRGVSQTAEDPAVQAGITVTHDSGFYVGTWASTIDADLTATGADVEIDLFAGYSREVTPGLTLDIGLLYYLYPAKGVDFDTDFFEPYLNVIGAVGPATIKAGVNYAWDQSAIADESAIYFHLEPSIAIPNTPLGLNAHIGYAESDSFLGGSDGTLLDYSVGATLTWKNLTFGVSYVDTDETKAVAEVTGRDGAVVFSLTAGF